MSAALLSVIGLSTHIDSENGLVRALDCVSFDVGAGETFALLGESGCGKSVTALSLMRLLPPGGFVAAGQRDAGRAGPVRAHRGADAPGARGRHGDDLPGARHQPERGADGGRSRSARCSRCIAD